MWITIAISGVFLIMDIIMFTGKGANLIAGFNTKPKEEKAKYDQKALSRFMGWMMLPIALMVAPVGYCADRGIGWYPIAFVVCIFMLIGFALIYLNTGNRYQK